MIKTAYSQVRSELRRFHSGVTRVAQERPVAEKTAARAHRLGILSMLLVCSFLTRAQALQQEPRLYVQSGHSSEVLSVVFSPDGKLLASGSQDNTIRLWEVASRRELRTFRGHSDQVNSVAFSPDGKLLASGSTDKTIKLWEVASGRELRTLYPCVRRKVHGLCLPYFAKVTFSPDGKVLASGSSAVILWEVATGRELRTLDDGSVEGVAFSPDGNTLASGGGDMIKLWEVASGRELRTLTHPSSVNAVAFSPDGKVLASGCWDKTIKLWELASGRELLTLRGHSDRVNSVAFSPDGKLLASESEDKTIMLWEVESGRELRTLSSYSQHLSSVAFSPDGKTLATGTQDKTIKLWEVESGRELRTLSGHSDRVWSVAFSPNGKLLASDDLTDIKLWEVASGRGLRTLSDRSSVSVGSSVAFSPDGKLLASWGDVFDKTIKLWEVESGRELRTLSGHSDQVNSVAFSPDGKLLASGSKDKTLKLWETESGRGLRTLSEHSGEVNSVAFSLDGKTLASGSNDKTIKLWEVASGLEVRTLRHSCGVHSVAFSPDGKLLASASCGIKLWELESGRELRTLLRGLGFVHSVAFSPDAKLLASVDHTEATLWQVESGRELRTISGISYLVDSVTFSPDSKTLASGSDDTKVKLWDVQSGKELASLIALDQNDWVAIDPAGRFDTNSLEENRGLHWIMPDDPMRPLPIEIFMRDYYEPGLLTRILKGEQFRPVRSLADLNRVQPIVKITSITQQKDQADMVTVTVKVSEAKSEFQRDNQGNLLETGAYDLRLFRDGQIVGQRPNTEVAEELYLWRKNTRLELGDEGKQIIEFKDIRLPRKEGLKQVEFSAYAFNEDRVKSATDRRIFDSPQGLAPVKGRAYLITVGVSAYENEAWDLEFAAKDAAMAQKVLLETLARTEDYADIVSVSLISDYRPSDKKVIEASATKANFKEVLELLSGAKTETELLKNIPNTNRLKKATPDDLVLIFFSSHGLYRKISGRDKFYFLPYDIGPGKRMEETPSLFEHSISNEELAEWLKGVDAGEMVLIANACQSEASVKSEGFKPGPLGNAGLGQLAYDKGMRILAASQALSSALEADEISESLLTRALISEGIQARQADFKPKDQKITLSEWLKYGEERVPKLCEELKYAEARIQRPVRFDFVRKNKDATLVK